ncbi:hypothetical protein NS334_08405 [Sphingomonas endophytica]|uniref:SGNH hydrolase-type esterase domain-containing protein n=1 Tax=Sphingomonas endophytica TaxID=869719 RepID=A0A147I3C1_9SPHN|nr:hypothetical protein NS334_08405 [Sphingomonas endophytica]
MGAIALALIALPAAAQIDPTITGLSAASAPTGGELVDVRQNGQKKAATVAQLTNTVQQRLKRAAARAAALNPEDAPENSDATLTMATSADASLTRIYSGVAGGNALTAMTLTSVSRFSGGRVTLDATNRFVLPVASAAPATNGNVASLLPATPSYQAWGWENEFGTEATRVQIRMAGFTSHAVRVLVDGRYVSKTPLAFAANSSGNYLTIDFGARKPRSIRIEGMQNDQIVSVAVAPTSSIWRMAGPQDRITAFVTGDSYAEGTGATYPGLYAWPKATGRYLGWYDTRQVAVGQTGYLSTGGGTRSTIRQQVASWFTVNSDLTGADVDVVVIAGGYNDYVSTPALVQPEALLTFQTIRAACPNAIIFVMGSHAGARGPDAQTLAIDGAVQSAFAQWADPRSVFVPVASDVSPWTFGTGYVGATNGSGNSDVAIAADGSHPSDLGHMIYTLRLVTALRLAIGRM